MPLFSLHAPHHDRDHPHLSPPTRMLLKKMTNRLSNMRTSRTPEAGPSSISPSPSMVSSYMSSSIEHRASLSTQRTSVTTWSKNVEVPEIPRIPGAVNRPQGSYKLADFNIHRTLGTGSFGRVHLGESYVFSLTRISSHLFQSS